MTTKSTASGTTTEDRPKVGDRIQLRAATRDDAAAIADVKHRSAAETYIPLIGEDAYEAWAAKRCTAEFISSRVEGSGLTIVEGQSGRTHGEKSGEIYGLGFVRPEDLDGHAGGFYLGDFYISEGGQGYGTALLIELTQQVRRLRGSYLWTLVFDTNTSAQDWFAQYGWEKVGERPNGEVDGGMLYEYRKDVTPSGGAYVLLDADRQPYVSTEPGRLGGWDGGAGRRLYGRLDCTSANSHIRAGRYVARRVFFADEDTAVAAGYRPCGRCMRDKYLAWKPAQS